MNAANPPEDSRGAETMKFMEALISRILLGGVLLSMAIVLVGIVLMFAHRSDRIDSAAELKRLTVAAAFPHTVADVYRGVATGQGRAVIALGLIVLLATPILRVAISLVGFAVERDWTYTAICAIVLVLLALSFFLGKVE